MLIPRINVLVECCPTAIQSQKTHILEQVKREDSFSQHSWWPQSEGELSIYISLAILNLFLAAVSWSGSLRTSIRSFMWMVFTLPTTTPRAPRSVVCPPGGGVTLRWGYTVALHTRYWEGGASTRVLCGRSHISSPSRQQFLSLPFSLCCAQIRKRLRQQCFQKTPLFPEPVLQGD